MSSIAMIDYQPELAIPWGALNCTRFCWHTREVYTDIYHHGDTTSGSLEELYWFLDDMLWDDCTLYPAYVVGYVVTERQDSETTGAPAMCVEHAVEDVRDTATPVDEVIFETMGTIMFQDESRKRAAYIRDTGRPITVIDFYPKGVHCLASVAAAPSPSVAFNARNVSVEAVNGDDMRWVPTLEAFIALFHIFAGPVANVTLPPGAFFAGSACVAASTLPGAGERMLALHAKGRDILNTKRQCKMLGKTIDQMLSGRTGPTNAVKTIIKKFLDLQGHADIEGLVRWSNDLFADDSEYEQAEERVAISDVFEDNGFAPYNRADVDIMIVCKTLEEGAGIVATLVPRIKACVGECIMVRTPNSLTFVPHFPQRHIQIILLPTRTLSEMLLFADLDCTALAFDGRFVYGCDRSMRAHAAFCNYVTPDMLQNRRDTPWRLAKYATRGFSSFVATATTPDRMSTELTRLANSKTCEFGKSYMRKGSAGWQEKDETTIFGDNTCYHEMNLPRGFDVTPLMIETFLRRIHEAKLDRGGKPVCDVVGENYAPETVSLVWKLGRGIEKWATWGLV